MHQHEGIQFLYRNFLNNDGCILADDMGLGKTVQISTYVQTLMSNDFISKVLIVVPTTLIDYWAIEIEKWRDHDKQVKVVKLLGSVEIRKKLRI